MMKSTFTLLHQQNIHISQYLGDTDNYDAQKNFEKALHHFLDRGIGTEHLQGIEVKEQVVFLPFKNIPQL